MNHFAETKEHELYHAEGPKSSVCCSFQSLKFNIHIQHTPALQPLDMSEILQKTDANTETSSYPAI